MTPFNTLAVALLQIWGNWISPIPSTASLYFAGDAMQHTAQIESAKSADSTYLYDNCFMYVKEDISKANLAVCNLEVSLGGAPYTGYPQFSAPDEFAKALGDAGFDILLTANNHCLDRGNKGLIRTLDVLDSLGIAHIGTYRNQSERDSLYPHITTVNNIKFAILNYTYGTNGIPVRPPCIVNLIDTIQILTDINKARKEQADVIITCIHWGDEYILKQNRQQEELADWLIENGVDHIIGGHPHVIQPVEIRKDKNGYKHHFIAYSLGNYISNMSARNTDIGLTATLTFSKIALTTLLTDIDTDTIRTDRNGFILRPVE